MNPNIKAEVKLILELMDKLPMGSDTFEILLARSYNAMLDAEDQLELVDSNTANTA